MGRGGKVGSKHILKRKVRSKDKGSDDSDEDYVVGEDEEIEVSDGGDSEDYCYSLEGDEVEESLCSLEEEEDMRKGFRSKAKMGAAGQRKIGCKTSKKRRRVLNEEDDDKDYEEEEEEEEEEEVEEEFLGRRKNRIKTSWKRQKVLYEEEEDEDYDEDYNEDDEEFTPEEMDCEDEEEETPIRKKKNGNKRVASRASQKKAFAKGRKPKRNSKVLKKGLRKKRKRNTGSRKKAKVDNDGDFIDERPVVRERKSHKRKRRLAPASDSEFVSSGSSDFEFTISEEEREQVREADEFCRRSTNNMRSASLPAKTIEEERKPPVRKGKEKVEDVKNEVGKQVCGICLSEEGKRRVRGTLDCCSHYFCFGCIMEWSKVESRCPLCKQRFMTISKPARANTGIDLRDVMIQVPERDQVYLPSEEEIRGYLDPYENVICTECHHGGDDGLMLLCDLCDSPAHTYCVGLGREVPEGNWYCEGCRPSQVQDPLSDHRTTQNTLSDRPSPVGNIGESLVTSLSLLSTPFTQGIGINISPRYRNAEAASPVSASGASLYQGDGGYTDNRYPSLQNMDLLSPRLSQSRRQDIQAPTTTATAGPARGTLWDELVGISSAFNSISGNEQLHQCSSRSSIRSDGSVSPNAVREGNHFHVVKEQLQSMVRSHLKSLSKDIDLGFFAGLTHEINALNPQLVLKECLSTFKDVARSSTHTILAAYGLEHRRSEVHSVPTPPICSHIERIADGQMSLMKSSCSCCFDSYVRDVVRRILNTKLPHWLGIRE
ncbi:PHD and RING finger domain-containing protein 1 [Vitis vinifera]|uniref:PHD and RING finger domain-containing protein 1 n=1 Tax=Vitis vinifera TaxID=29760 RepID=A0A438IMJ1_VITVI|nr:PHD and RING finger domain-containing protein 1 [Vitis vinifera]